MGGHQVPGMGSGDDGYDEEGYDESQRAEILEATRDGPSDGVVLTDINPDIDMDDDEDDIDSTPMDSREVGESDTTDLSDEMRTRTMSRTSWTTAASTTTNWTTRTMRR